MAFAIQGLRGACPKGAADVEHVLARLDGVVAARVNYATERATVVYDPTRVTLSKLVNAIRHGSYDTPVERLTLHSDDLWYATSAPAVEHVLERAEEVAHVSTDLAARRVTVEILPEYRARGIPARTLARFGLRAIETGRSGAQNVFWLRSAILLMIELLAVWSAGAHAGLLPAARADHSPLVLVALSFVTLFVAALPFYRFAYAAARHGEFDATVIAALLASVLALGSLTIGLLSPHAWMTDIGFLIAATFTSGWFSARALTLWVFPRWRGMRRKVNLVSAAPAQLGIVKE